MREVPTSAFASVERSTTEVTATVAPGHAAHASDGHFPDEPLLPGSAIVELMAAAAALLPSGRPQACGIVHATFRRRILPTDEIVVVARAAGDDTVEAIVHANHREAARGAVRVRPAS